MADRSALIELPSSAANATRPLRSTLSRWLAPAAAVPAAEVALGYESALPWTLPDGEAESSHASPY